MNDFKCPEDVATALATGNGSFCMRLEQYEEELNFSMTFPNLTNHTVTNPFGFRLNSSCCPKNPVLQGIFFPEGNVDWGNVEPGCIAGIPGLTDTSTIAGKLPVCLSVCLPVCLSAYLPVCLSVCLSACLPVCLSACLSVCLPVCLSVCLSACLSACLPVCLPACLPVCLSVCLSACLPVCLPICLSACLSVCCACAF